MNLTITPEVKVLSPKEFSLSVTDAQRDKFIKRDHLIGTIESLVENGNKYIIIDGVEGIGKTTLLLQFLDKYYINSISYFANPSSKLSYSPEYLIEDIGRQMLFFIHKNALDEFLQINEATFDRILIDFHKATKRGNKPIFILLDGLDQIEKGDFESIKDFIDRLPWNVNNINFLLTGDEDKIKKLIPELPSKSTKTFHVPRMSYNEASELFKYGDPEINFTYDQFTEIHNTWRGNPRRIQNIYRIIKQGTSIEEFLEKEIKEKEDLLTEEWIQSKVEDLDKENQKLIAVIAIDDKVRTIQFLAEIGKVDLDNIKELVGKISFLKIINDEVIFISKELKRFAAKRLKAFASSVYPLIIEYYQVKDNIDSYRNLPSYYERTKDWKSIVDLLSLENLNSLISKSSSITDIKTQINSGYKASSNLINAHDRVLRFSLHKSTIISLQEAEIRESYVEACVALDKLEDALLVISDAILKEDKFRLLSIYAKECQLRNIHVDTSLLEQIQELAKVIDIEYLRDNIAELSLNIASILPDLAVKLVEQASGIKENDASLEWLLSYISIMSNNDGSKFDWEKDSKTLNNFRKKLGDKLIDKFVDSVGFGLDKLNSIEIIESASRIENTSDRLLVLRSWIKKNQELDQIANVIIYSINTLTQESSHIKPTTTMLLDIVAPIIYLNKSDEVNEIVAIVTNLSKIISNPTADKVRLELLLVECELKFDLGVGNKRLLSLYNFITSIEDYSTKIEAFTSCWYFLRNFIRKGNKPFDCIFREDELIREIMKYVSELVNSTSEHFEDLRNTLQVITLIDLDTSLTIVSKFNTQHRRDDAYIEIAESYSSLSMKEIDPTALKKIFNIIKSPFHLNAALFKVFDTFYKQKDVKDFTISKFVEILPLINLSNSYSLKSGLLVRSILILNRSYNNDKGLKIKFPKVLNKLVSFLKENWQSIDSQIEKLETGYKISALLAEYDKVLAEDYFDAAKIISSDCPIDNFAHLSCFAETVSLTIRAYVGNLILQPELFSEEVEELIELVEEELYQLILWNELAVRLWLANAKPKSVEIVTSRVIPLLDLYKISNKGQYYFDRALKICAPSIYLAKPHTLDHYLDSATPLFIEMIISDLCTILLTKNYHGDPFDEIEPNPLFDFEDASRYIQLINRINSDETLYFRIAELCKAGTKNKNLFSIEQRVRIKDLLKKLVEIKFPNKVYGIDHEGYKIVSEMQISHFDFASYNDLEYTKFINNLLERTNKIPNSSDKSYIYSVIANECATKFRKRTDIIEKAFQEADNCLSYQCKFQRYELALKTAQKFAHEKFVNRLQKINSEIYTLDNSEYIPTHRRLIDLAYQHNKEFAERLVSSLDKDPARNKNTVSVIQHLNKIQTEQLVLDDFNNFHKIKVKKEVSKLAWRMLGELNSGKRSIKDLDKMFSLLKAGSQLPLHESSSLYQLYLQNAIKKLSFSKQVSLMNSFYNAVKDNSKMTHAFILNIANVKASSSSKSLSKGKGSSQIFTPGSHQEAINFIADYLLCNRGKDIYIIDPYFGAKDVKFLKDITNWCPDSSINIITSVDADKSKNNSFKQAFLESWNEISKESPNNISVFKMSTIESSPTSPFHDRWILINDLEKGLNLGSSTNSIASGKTSAITVMSPSDVNSVYVSVVEPFTITRAKTYGKLRIARDSFEL